MRTIAGTVNNNGTINSGTGFSVYQESEGLYTITFKERFNSLYGGGVSQIHRGEGSRGGDTRDNALFVFLEDGSMRVKTGNSSGNASNRDFTFIVTGA